MRMTDMLQKSFLSRYLPWVILFSLVTILASRLYQLPFALFLGSVLTSVAFLAHQVNVRYLYDRFFNRYSVHWYALAVIGLIALSVLMVGLVSMLGTDHLNLDLSESQSAFISRHGAFFFIRRATGQAMIMVLIASTTSKLLWAQTEEATENEPKRIILLRADGQDHKVNLNDVLYLKAESEYVCYNLKNEKLMVHGSLSEASINLATLGFVRVHRSYTVSSAHIRSIGTKSLTLADKTEIPIGRTFRDAVRSLSLAE